MRYQRILTALTESQWAILPESLEQMLAIIHNANQRLTEPEAFETGQFEKRSPVYRVRDGVAVIDITGPIFRRASFFTEISGATSLDKLNMWLQDAIQDRSVNGILLNIDSPGGQINGVSEFADLVHKASTVKPIYTYAADKMCSAAYWIGAAAKKIIAADTSTIGSIGVVVTYNKVENATIELVNSLSPDKRLDVATDEGKKKIIMHLDSLAEIFYSKVATYRNTTTENVIESYGKGGVFVGTKALTFGMVDVIGSFESAITMLQEEIRRNHMSKQEEKIEHAPAKAQEALTPQIDPAILAEIEKNAVAKAEANFADKLASMEKELFMQKISSRITEKELSAVMDLYTGTNQAGLTKVVDLLAEKSANISTIVKELGAPKGTSDTTVTKVNEEEEIKKIMAEDGLSETDAYVEFYKRNAKKE